MRPRKKDRNLPACLYFRHGSYFYVKKGLWQNLGRDYTRALEEYARLTTRPAGGMVQLMDRFLEDAEGRVTAATMKQYRGGAEKVKEVFSQFAPSQVEPRHIGEYMDHLRKTPNMANRVLSILKMAFDHAVRVGMCEHNPTASIKRFKEGKRKRYITDAEYDAIMKHSPPALAAIIDIAYLTAQRIGDVLSIKLSDITADGIMFEQQKTGARLLVAMNPGLSAAIARAKAVHGKTPRMYLLGQRNGRMRSYRGVRDLFGRACARANVPDAHLHDLRAKSLTDAKKQGLNAQTLAGHTTEAQTVRYIRSRETALVQGPSIGHVQNNGQK